MGRARRGTSSSRTGTLLLVALGAVAGLAIGMAVADRAGGVDGMLRRRRSRRQRRHPEASWSGYDTPLYDGAHDEMEHEDEHAADHGEEHETEHRPAPAPVLSASHAGMSAPSADELELRVLEVFRNDPLLASRDVDIGADHHGRIELTGWVEGRDEVELALTLARGVPQVTGVVSNLMVRRRTAG